jgi:hypothetical protein
VAAQPLRILVVHGYRNFDPVWRDSQFHCLYFELIDCFMQVIAVNVQFPGNIVDVFIVHETRLLSEVKESKY